MSKFQESEHTQVQFHGPITIRSQICQISQMLTIQLLPQPIIRQDLQENERIWTERGDVHSSAPWDLPMVSLSPTLIE